MKSSDFVERIFGEAMGQAEAAQILTSAQHHANALAAKILAARECPEDLIEWGRIHGIPTFAQVTWQAGFLAGIGRCEMDTAIAEITRLRAALTTARREGMEEAAQWHDQQAAEAQKLADMKVSALDEQENGSTLREFRKVWGDYAENHREFAAAIRAAAKEGKP